MGNGLMVINVGFIFILPFFSVSVLGSLSHTREAQLWLEIRKSG